MQGEHKKLRIEQDGYVWHVPATAVAYNRAVYYYEKQGEDLLDEIKEAMASDEELLYWYQNNMNWEDVAARAELVESPDTAPVPDFNSEVSVI